MSKCAHFGGYQSIGGNKVQMAVYLSVLYQVKCMTTDVLTEYKKKKDSGTYLIHFVVFLLATILNPLCMWSAVYVECMASWTTVFQFLTEKVGLQSFVLGFMIPTMCTHRALRTHDLDWIHIKSGIVAHFCSVVWRCGVWVGVWACLFVTTVKRSENNILLLSFTSFVTTTASPLH